MGFDKTGDVAENLEALALAALKKVSHGGTERTEEEWKTISLSLCDSVR